MHTKRQENTSRDAEFKKMFYKERQRCKEIIEERNGLQEQVFDLLRNQRKQTETLATVSEEKKALEVRLFGLKKLQGVLDLNRVAKNHHRWSLRSAQSKKPAPVISRSQSMPRPEQLNKIFEIEEENAQFEAAKVPPRINRSGSRVAMVGEGALECFQSTDDDSIGFRVQTAPSKSYVGIQNKRNRPASVECNSRMLSNVDWGFSSSQAPLSPGVMEWTPKLSQELRSEWKVKHRKEKCNISDSMWRVFFDLKRDMNKKYTS